MISVIIPVYNVEKYLHVCLNSVLNQSYSNFEVICIDDASTDSSWEILEYFSKKDSRVKIFKNKVNKGPGFSRNKGLKIASGNYISFLDGDDWFCFNAFELLIEKIKKYNLDLLLFKNIVYYDDSKMFGFENYYDMKFMSKWHLKIFNHWDLDKTKLFLMSNAPWNKFYLKSFLDDNKLYFPNENLIHEDNPFFYSVITSAKRISFLNEYLHNRRRRQGSITTLKNERLFDNINIVYEILNIFIKDKKLYEYYKKQVLEYVFEVMLNDKYVAIEDRYKEKFFNEVLIVYENFYSRYGIKEDILKYVNKNVLKKFNQIE